MVRGSMISVATLVWEPVVLWSLTCDVIEKREGLAEHALRLPPLLPRCAPITAQQKWPKYDDSVIRKKKQMLTCCARGVDMKVF
jgi:hypothetical protein